MNDTEEVGFTPAQPIQPDAAINPAIASGVQPALPPQVPGLGSQPAFTPQPLLQAPVLPTGVDSIARTYAGPTAQGVARAEQQGSNIAQRAQGFAAQDAQATNQEIDQYNTAIGREQAAVEDSKQVQRDYSAELSDIGKQQEALYAEAARQEEEARRDAKIAGAEFVDKYSQQLAAVRAMSVDINGPLSKLSTGERGGLALGLFAQGFLAAQGINIDVQGQINRWVDLSIQEQRRQIDQAERGAQDTLNLYNIARQNSHDDLEARQRYRGYILDSLKSQVEVSAARFNSALAISQADILKAKLDKESALNTAQMRDKHEERVLKEKTWQTDTAYKMQMVNLEQQKVELERERNRAKPPGIKQQLIVDPSDGKYKWVVRQDRINAENDAKVASEAQANYDKIDKQIKEAIQFKQKHANDLVRGYFNALNDRDEAKRFYSAMVDSIAMEMTRAQFGKASSDTEAERVKKLLPFDRWYQNGNNADTWTKLREDVRSSFEATVSAHADALPQDLQQEAPRNTVNPAVKAEWKATSEGGAAGPRFVQEEVSKVVDVNAKEKPGEHNYPSQLYSKWVGEAKGKRPVGTGFDDLEEADADSKSGDQNMSQWAIAIDHLAAGWLRPKEVKEFGDNNYIFFGTQNETPDEIRQQSLNALRQIASGETEGGEKVDPKAAMYAKWIIKQDEAEARNLVLPPQDTWSDNPIKHITGLASQAKKNK